MNNETPKLSIALKIEQCNLADGFIKEWGAKCNLKGDILDRLVFVVNETVSAIIELANMTKIEGKMDLIVEPFSSHMVVNISFPKEIPLDPQFDYSDDLLEEFPTLKLNPDIFWRFVLVKWVDKASWQESRKNTIISITQYSREDASASELYFLSMKPKLVKKLELIDNPEGGMMVLIGNTDITFRLRPRESFILRQIDGKTTARDIFYACAREFGMMHPKTFGRIIEDFSEKGIIQPDKPLSKSKHHNLNKLRTFYNRISKISFAVRNSNDFFNKINKHIGWLWSTRATVVYLVFIISSFVFFSFHHPLLKNLLTDYFKGNLLSESEIWLGIYVAMAFNIIIHELSHGLVCKRYGGNIHAFGIMFYYIFPSAFVDTTEAWMFKNKWHRVMVSLAGPFATLLTSLLYFWLWFLNIQFQNMLIAHIFAASFVMSLMSVFINLSPFLQSDGYYILMDIFEMHNLRKSSKDFVKEKVLHLFGKESKSKVPLREQIIYYTYASSNLLFTILIGGFILHTIINKYSEYSGVIIWLGILFMVLMVSMLGINAGFKWYRKSYLAPLDLKSEKGNH